MNENTTIYKKKKSILKNMNMRHYLLTGLLLTTCAPNEDTPKKESLQSPSRLESVCPQNQPDELTARVLSTYQKDPQRLRAAAQKMARTEAYHLYRALHDESAVRDTLKEVFDVHGVACAGFSPSVAEFNAKATELMSGKHFPHLEEALELFENTGNIDGQRSVAQRYEQDAAKEDSYYSRINDLEQAITLYRKIGDTANVQRVTQQIFVQDDNLDSARRQMRSMGVEVTSALYRARGDYWLAVTDVRIYDTLDKAFESYQLAQDREGASKVLEAIGRKAEPQRTIYFNLAAKVALYLEDTTTARECLEEYFVHDYGMEPEMKQLATRVGMQITPALYQRRGEHLLHENNFWGAYKAFQEAHDERGLQRVVEAMGTP